MADLGFIARHPVLRFLLIPLLFTICFVLSLALSFPYDTLARRLEYEAGRAGYEMTIGKLGHTGLFGLRAIDLKVRDPNNSFELDRVDVKPEIFALLLRRPAFSFSFDGYGGSGHGHASLAKDTGQLSALTLDAKEVDLHAVLHNLIVGIDVAGRATLKIDLPSLTPDAATGQVSLSVKDAAISGGTVMGFPIPKTALGALEATAQVDKNVVKVDKAGLHGGDVDADLDGTVQLRPLRSLSIADLHVKFRPVEKWLNDNPMIRGSMGFVQNGKQSDGSYLFTLSGPISALQPRPGR